MHRARRFLESTGSIISCLHNDCLRTQPRAPQTPAPSRSAAAQRRRERQERGVSQRTRYNIVCFCRSKFKEVQMLKELASAGLGSTIALHQILGEGHDHSHSECMPPERYCIYDMNLSA